MRVLIVYASRYGATQGIAERVAAILRQQGLTPLSTLHSEPVIPRITTRS